MISTSENQVIYLGNGVNTHFSYNFKIINYTDLHLIRVDSDGNETEVTSDFYVHMDTSIVDYPGYAPGAVEPVADQPLPLQTGEKIVIYRDIPITQEDDMPEQWPFDVLEDALDKSCIIDQQLQEQINRGLKINRSAYTSNFDGTIPVVAGKSFRISDDGKSIEATDDPAEARSAAEGAANTASASAATASAAATRAESAASTATTKKNETQTLATSVITKLEELKHDGIWEYDLNVDLQPVENPMQNRYFEHDDDGNLTPIDVSTMVGGLQQAVIGKQDKLTAGANITIQNNVISASGGVSDAYTKAETDNLLSAKANTSTTYSKDEVDGQFSTVSGDIANRVSIAQGAENDGKYLVVGADGNVTLGEGASGGVTDVQVNGTSITVDGVANIPSASASDLGVVGVYGILGITTNAQNRIYVVQADNNKIAARNTQYCPITPNNLDYAVKCALCDGKGAAYTDEEKASARARIGLDVWEELDSVTLEEEVSSFDFVTTKVIKKAILQVVAPANSSNGANVSQYFRINNNVCGYTSVPLYRTSKSARNFYFEKQDGLIKSICADGFIGGAYVYGNTFLFRNETTYYDNAKKIGIIVYNNVFPIGTVFHCKVVYKE